MDLNLISIIIPVNNEENNIVPLFTELNEVFNGSLVWIKYEVIFIDDWSTDDSWKVVTDLKKINWNIAWIKLNRRYGQSIALQAWINKSNWNIIVTLDWDGQNNPSDIPRLYKELITWWYDVVAWWRKKRQDKFFIKLLSKTGRFFRKIILNDNILDSGCSLRIYHKKSIDNIYLWWEMHRYILHLIKAKWYSISQIEVEDRVRIHWKSKYWLNKSIRGFLDLFYIAFIYKYQARPLHFFGSLGLFNWFMWFCFFWIAAYQKIFMNESINRSWYFIVGMFLFQIGFMLFIFGIILDFLIRIYYETSYEKRFEIREEI